MSEVGRNTPGKVNKRPGPVEWKVVGRLEIYGLTEII